jgi:deazaflavin-dependent oxidoreductase (nitroreductase family)
LATGGLLLVLDFQHLQVQAPAMQAKTPLRIRKYRLLKVLLAPGNRLTRWQLRHGLAPRAFALIETTGRRTGRPCQTCVGYGLAGDSFWVVAAHGQQADWVRNISRDGQVRVLVNGRWRRGTATILPDDDPQLRSHTLPYRWDAAIGRAVATTPLSVRIDLQGEPRQRPLEPIPTG